MVTTRSKTSSVPVHGVSFVVSAVSPLNAPCVFDVVENKEKLAGAVGIEPATLALPVQCLCDSTSRKLVHGSVQTDKDFQKIRQLTRGEKRRLGELGNSRLFQKAN